MNAGFTTLDYIIFIAYAVLIVSLGLWLSRGKEGKEEDAKDYFLAGGTLSWWAIGASLIAANISAEHFIAMSGSGFAVGLGIAAYEWIAAITLILVAKFLLPQMIDKKIYTMPQFASERYGKGVSFFFSFFWLLVYVFVNLTSVAWLGAMAMDQILGVPMAYGVPGLLLFAGLYSIYGGLKAVAWTDVIQVIFLVGGGLITAFFALDAVAGDGGSAWDGFLLILDKVRSVPSDVHFNMIIPEGVAQIPDGTNGMKDVFMDLPGLAVIFGAMWLTNLGYWGFNQYIIQKGLAAKNLKEAKRGLIFAGYLKILIPIIVIIPGITAYVMFNHPELSHTISGLTGSIDKSDQAYPWLLRNFAPIGIRGLAFAALVAAVVSSLASMLNSTSTIFTLDIYKAHINKEANDKKLVLVGRVAAAVALVIAIFAAKPLLGGLDQAFQYIQEYTGFIYPGVVVVFGMGILWKRATNRAALWTTIITIPIGILMKIALPDLPFIIRMGYVCMVLITVAIVLVLTDPNKIQAETISDVNRKKLIGGARVFAILTGVTFIAGLLWGTELFGMSMMNLGFHSIFMMTFMMAFLAIIMYTNANSDKQDAKAYSFNPELFATDKSFFFGAAGIVVIIVALYAYFW
ncbi:MAG: sodium/solute symporter [Marinilabiliaceae bacterium]|nr:sodium/solute symporter [Marinilabiliaceae bacterium]